MTDITTLWNVNESIGDWSQSAGLGLADGDDLKTAILGLPDTAYYVCRHNGCVIHHNEKAGMVKRGSGRQQNI
ncbi:hypothetical protein [Yersinia ruckeri]|uniref:hypothetical protein n=1 Tax=Yersinia ruckeri TaxID=29486 RepID=UPI0030C7D043